jgi:hypothetical protein
MECDPESKDENKKKIGDEYDPLENRRMRKPNS